MKNYRYNTVYSGESQSRFRLNKSPPFSRPEKNAKQEIVMKCGLILAGFLLRSLLDAECVGDMFFRKAE